MKRLLLLSLAAGAVLAPAIATAQVAPVCDSYNGYADAFDGRRTFLWRPDDLAAIKARLDDATLRPARQALMARADAALARPAYTVVDKTQTPASGDKHDYMSMGPYWWPDPARPDGLPYVRRDGRMNPERETNAFDLSDLENLSQDVQALALAWHFTGEKRYADKAAAQIRAWFLAPETRMTPNLNHGQAVPGRVSGRAEGVIDAHRFPRIIESVGLLHDSGALSDAEQAALRDWFAELVQWMASSPIGREERAAENNHGVFYDMLITDFALFAGMEDVARAVTEGAKVRRLDAQIAPDGRLPHELTRTRSLHYTTWTLAAAFDLADLARCVGVDLWGHQTPTGGSLRKAVDFVAPYAGRTADWPFPELDKTETASLYETLRRAAREWPDGGYGALADRLAAENAALDLNLRMSADAAR